MPVDPALYRRHRFPPEIISHAVWLYYRFNVSHRDVEELLAERGIQVSYEAIRLWCRKFGPAYAEQLRRRRPGPADKWHVDEMQLKIRGKKYWLWRAVDQDGFVLDILVQERRNEQAAAAFLRRVLAAAGGAPRVIVTDKLASYVPAVKRVLPTTEHRRHKRLNNRAENSHLPVRKRERVLQRFKSGSSASLGMATQVLIGAGHVVDDQHGVQTAAHLSSAVGGLDELVTWRSDDYAAGPAWHARILAS